MKTPLAGRNAKSRIRVFLLATGIIIAVTPRLSGDIILLDRLSDAVVHGGPDPPPQSQTGFLPANLCNHTEAAFHQFYIEAGATSNSSIFINKAMKGLRVVGDGTATAGEYGGLHPEGSAKLIVLSFTLTEVSYPYSITGQLNGESCEPSVCAEATAKLTGETGTIFEKIGTTLSESGTLPPGNYTLSVDVYASIQGTDDPTSTRSEANFTFALDGPMSTPAPTPTPIPVTRPTNLSTRLLIDTGNNVGIGGFIITGTRPATRHILIRGIGPSLSGTITNALSDPSLSLQGSSPCGFQTLTNNNWRDTQETEIIATGRPPSNDLESAIVADLAPGSYTAILAGNADTTGVGLIEIWDLSPDQDSRLANISTRGNVGTGNDIMIAGCILGGASGEDLVILRGLGPSLNSFTGLPDPKLELRNSQGVLIASNDNWMDDPNQAAIIQTAGLAPSNDLESAIAATLMPGEYTALLSGLNDGTGLGLVEVYENPGTLPTPSPTPTPCNSSVVFRTDFESGLPPEFSGEGALEEVQGYVGLGTGSNTFGGHFLRNATTDPPLPTRLTLTGLPPHNGISLRFLLAIIDSWDGNNCDGDGFTVRLVDDYLFFYQVFENSYCGSQTYLPPRNVQLARHSGLFGQNGGAFNDSAYDMGADLTFSNLPHTSSTLTIEWSASGPGWLGGADESWAIENVEVSTVGTCPTPTPRPTHTPVPTPTPSLTPIEEQAAMNKR